MLKAVWPLCVLKILLSHLFLSLFQFFQWVDDIRGCQGNSRTDKLTMSDPLSITTFVRNHNVHFYCGCHFIKKSTESIMNHFKRNVPVSTHLSNYLIAKGCKLLRNIINNNHCCL